MITLSAKHNPNYLAKIVLIGEQEFLQHPNADKLKCILIDFQNVITGIDNPGGVYIYFPVESQISDKLLSNLNLYRKEELNVGTDTGFFEANRRVKALKLRGEYSQGFILPAEEVAKIYNVEVELFGENIGEYFDSINEEVILNKYEIPIKQTHEKKGKDSKQLSRLVDGQVHLHEDTDNIRKEIGRIPLNVPITISYKYHGTSGWASHVLVKRKLNWMEKLLSLVVNIQTTEYDLVYGSRKVVKNRNFGEKAHTGFYKSNVWKDVVETLDIKNRLPKGYSLYYEIVGYTSDGTAIQKGYTYMCPEKTYKVLVYRVTFTNPDGLVYNFTSKEAKNFCDKLGFFYVDIEEETTLSDFGDTPEEIISNLEKKYNGKKCRYNPTMPEEGVVIRVERTDKFEAYKLKDAAFILEETKQLDNEEQ